MLKSMAALLSLAFLALALAGCPQAARDGATTTAAGGGAGATTTTAGETADLSGIDACKIVPPEKVAELVGGKSMTTPVAGNPFCAYVIEHEDGSAEAYDLRYSPANEITVVFDVMSDEEKGKKVDGPWDVAYLGPDALTKRLRILIVKGDIGIEVSGDSEETIVEIAKLAAEGIQ